MTWQRLLTACAALLVGPLAAPVPAQAKADPAAAQHHDRVSAMAARPGLSGDQKEQVRKIIADYDPMWDAVERQMWALRHEERQALVAVAGE